MLGEVDRDSPGAYSAPTMVWRSRFAHLVLAAAASLGGASACAHRRPVAPPPPSSAEDGARLTYIQDLLDEEQGHARRWWWGWWSTHTALTVGQAAVALTTDDADTRASTGVGAAGALLGSVSFLFIPYPGIGAADELRALPNATPEQRAAKLAVAERLLAATAEAEADQSGWWVRIGGVAVAGAMAGLLWLHYDLPIDAALTFAGGIATTELQIYTSPTRAHRAHAHWHLTFTNRTATLGFAF